QPSLCGTVVVTSDRPSRKRNRSRAHRTGSASRINIVRLNAPFVALSLHPSRSMRVSIADLPSHAPKPQTDLLPVSSFGADFLERIYQKGSQRFEFVAPSLC